MSENGNNDLQKGTRKRMLQRYLKSGIDGFEEHEILEIILSSACPGRNTNDIACELISAFGSLRGVIMADYSDLLKTKNVNKTAAALICFLKDFIRLNDREPVCPVKLNSVDNIFKFCRDNMIYSPNEQGYILYLDKDYNYVSEIRIYGTSPESLSIDIRQIVKEAININSPNVVIIHTHPTGSAKPSGFDIAETKRIIKVFDGLSLNLVDHVIVHGEEMISIRKTTNITGWSSLSY